MPTLRLSLRIALLAGAVAGCSGGGDGGEPNRPPQAPQVTPIALQVDEDTVLSAQLSASDPDGESVAFAKTTDAQHGALTVSAQGAIVYTPAANFNGMDAFTIQAADPRGGTASSAFTVTVRPINDAPIISSTAFTFAEDVGGSGQLIATDPENGGFSFYLEQPPSHGTLVLRYDGTFDFSPAKDFVGNDTFTAGVVDDFGAEPATTTAAISLRVSAQSDAPTALDDRLRVPATAGPLDVLANDFDADGGTSLFVTVLTQPRGGTVAVANSIVTFQPDNGFRGPTSFTYRVSDDLGLTDDATAQLIVGDFPGVLFIAGTQFSSGSVSRKELYYYDGFDSRVVNTPQSGEGVTSFFLAADGRYLTYVGSYPASISYRAHLVDLQQLGSTTELTSYHPAAVPTTSLRRDGSYATIFKYDTGPPLGNVGPPATTSLRISNTSIPATTNIVKPANAFPTGVGVFNPVSDEYYFRANVSTAVPPVWNMSVFSTLFAGTVGSPNVAQIGATYSAGADGTGSANNIRVTPDGLRVIHTSVTFNPTVGNLLVNDRASNTETFVNRQFAAGEFPEPFEYDLNSDGSLVCMRVNGAGSPSTGPGRVWIAAPIAGGSATAVTPIAEYNFGCQWAADNKTVLYTSAATGGDKREIWQVDTTQPNVIRRLREPLVGGEELDYFALAERSMTAIVGLRPAGSAAPELYRAAPDAPGTSIKFAAPGILTTDARFTLDAQGDWLAYVKAEPSSTGSGTAQRVHLVSTRIADHDIVISSAGERRVIGQLEFKP